MEEQDTWSSLFWSGKCPDILKTKELNITNFQQFTTKDENWTLGPRIDVLRKAGPTTVQVIWLRINGHRRYVAKVFPRYTEEDSKKQLLRISILPTPQNISQATLEFDRFTREARVYSRIEKFCTPKIAIRQGLSGFWHERAVIIEAILPTLYSRRILSEDIQFSNDFLEILESLCEELQTAFETMAPSLSPFEQDWYTSLLKDRLPRLDTLHRVGITHGDIHDLHFRLPDDFYDTVLYDFSASYTFSEKEPFRVNCGRPRPLCRIAKGERARVLLGIKNRANERDLRSYLIKLNSESSIDDALWKPLENEGELLELIILKVRFRPDGFLMPTLNSVFPFLEALSPESDPCWCIRRGRLLHHYKYAWAAFAKRSTQPAEFIFDREPEFTMIEREKDPRFMLCLVPKSWTILVQETDLGFDGYYDKLRHFCSLLVLDDSSGAIIKREEFKNEEGKIVSAV